MLQCMSPLVAQSGRSQAADQCPLLGVKRKSNFGAVRSVDDPFRKSFSVRASACGNHHSLRRALCDSDASILPPSLRRYQSIGRFCIAASIRRSSVQSTAAYSFKGLPQIIKLMAELGTLLVREGKRRTAEMLRFRAVWHQEEKLKCARPLEPQRL
jgi:hypothetical protein